MIVPQANYTRLKEIRVFSALDFDERQGLSALLVSQGPPTSVKLSTPMLELAHEQNARRCTPGRARSC